MWTVEQRQAHARVGLRYPSDLTDAEWALAEPLILPARRGGRKRTVDTRAVLDGIFYVLATGCQWRALPKDLPPRSTVHDHLTLWAWDGTLRRLHHALFIQVREQAGKEASPTAAIVDSQSVRSAEKGGLASIHAVTTRARRSRARSGTSWSTRSACC
jgi:transposase